MNEETVLPTEVSDSVSTEPASVADESTAAETVSETEPEVLTGASDETTVETTEETTVTEPEEDQSEWLPGETETVQETTEEIVEVIDYTPAIGEATSVIANIILCGALMVVGALCGIRLWR